jgi:hypothetical protein
MGAKIVVLLVTFISFSSHAGSLASQFSLGYENVPWGTSISDLVAMRPGGYHKFSSEPSDRTYELVDEAPLFGIARERMRMYYILHKDIVYGIWAYFPYESRQQLLGFLTLSFGPYQSMKVRGISTYYWWPLDNGFRLELVATLDPDYGILAVLVDKEAMRLEDKEMPTKSVQ